MTTPSIQVNNGFYNTAGYVDFSNPSARAWWFTKVKPLYDAGIAGSWTDLGEPEQDTATDYLFGGHRESEMHNVYSFFGIRAGGRIMRPTTRTRGFTS